MDKLISMTDRSDAVFEPVIEYEGLYSINRSGILKSDFKIIGNRIIKEKILKDRINAYGYNTCVLRKNGESNYLITHRLVAINFIPNPENKPQVNHINGIKTDNRVENLEWCSVKENINHGWETGLMKNRKGESSPTSKLTEKEILDIKKLKGHITNQEIADIFNISKSYAGKILTGKAWCHLNQNTI